MKINYSLQTKLIKVCLVLFSVSGLTAQDRSVQKSNTQALNRKTLTDNEKLEILKLKSTSIKDFKQSDEGSLAYEMKGKQEDLPQRNEVSKTYINQDGSFTSVIAAGPIHYQNKSNWEDIDTNISKESSGEYGFSNKANSMQSFYGSNSTTGVKSVIKEGELKEFLNTSMYWEKNGVALNKVVNSGATATVKGDELYYKNLYGSISAEFKSLTGKRKLTYVIPNKLALGEIPADAEYLVFSEDIILAKDWTYEVKENRVFIKNTKGDLLFVFQAPAVFEEYLSSENFKLTRDKPTVLEIKHTGDTLTYILKIKKDWLTSDDRKFPLGIDPTVLSYPKNEVYQAGLADSSGFGFDDLLQVGFWYGDEVNGYARFDLSAIPAGSTVTAATSSIYRFNGQDAMNNRTYRPGISTFDPRDWLAYQILGLFDDFYYGDIFYSYVGNLSLAYSTNFSMINQMKSSLFDATGRATIQNGLPDGYINVLFYPTGTYTPTTGFGNYGLFYGYTASASRKPRLSVTYTAGCSPATSTSSTRYINNVKFIGTLNPDTNNPSGYTAGGYADYKALPNKAKQIPGGGINVYISNVGTAAAPPNFIKAWVDWNKDGVFDPVIEKVYDSGNVLTVSTTFGFIVPAVAAGNYNVRIRTYYYEGEYDQYGYYYGPCGSRPNGETEDYTIEVIADCAAKITSVIPGKRCGNGVVNLSAVGTGSSYKWYASEFGTAIPGAITATYSPTLAVGSYTYYVTAVDGTCESSKKTPVKVLVSPIPIISFLQSIPSICGDGVSLSVSSSGDKEEVTLFTEDFTTLLGVFVKNQLISNGGTVNNATNWQSKTSTFIPTGAVWFPAINSGTVANKFAYATSDILPPAMPGYSINTTLTYNSTPLNSTGFLNLSLAFDSYFSYFGTAGEGLYIEVSTDGVTWVAAQTYTSSIGIGTRFENQIVNLNSYINVPNLRLRFRYAAGWADGVAIDNVRLFGEKPLATNFAWSAPNIAVFNSDCVTPYSGANTQVCIKPTDQQLEDYANWTITASATLSNGCSASGDIVIQNDSKVWNTGSTDWSNTNWKPNTAIPTTLKCVIIKTPVNVPAASIPFPFAEAKNITIKAGGTLNIQTAGVLKVTDAITSTANPNDFVIEDDGILLQTNSVANIGNATAQRKVTDMDNVLATQMDYVFWSSPVAGQNLQAFSPFTTPNRIYYYDESTDKFRPVNFGTEPNFIAAKGYSFRAETSGTHIPNPIGYDETYSFKGNLNNGDRSISINRSPDVGLVVHGYNLVGNPYPSNINFDLLYYGNSALIWNTAYFWTNNTYEPSQQQQGYSGNNYAIYNGSGGNSATAAASGTGVTAIPNGIVKVGQGIIVQKKTLGSGTLQFKHNYIGNTADLRVSSTGTFFQKEASPKNRFWINLMTPNNLVNTQLIAYVEGATDGFDGDYDAEAFGLSSDIFYSLMEDKKLLIQGKANNFSVDDVIPVGANFFQNGNYTIALDSTEGIFAQDQVIYLKDKLLNIYTDLRAGAYTFAANAGLTDGRFEIAYKTGAILTTDASTKYGLEIYRDAEDFVVRSPQKEIKNVEVYDASGRLILKLSGMQKEWRFPVQKLTAGMFVVKATLKTDETVSRKIRK